MIRRLGHRCAAIFRAITPDPFVLAVGLTLVVFAMALVFQGASPVEVVRAWQGDKGFWSLLAFTMQMLLILVTGHALASSPPLQRAIQTLARQPLSSRWWRWSPRCSTGGLA
jgi:short-chain fatty acids transporter